MGGPIDEGEERDPKKSLPSLSIRIGLLSSGLLVAAFLVGGFVIFKKRNVQFGNDQVIVRDAYFDDVFYNSDSDSDSDDNYFDKDFNESMREVDFNICVES